MEETIMKVHINSVNNIAQTFFTEDVLPKYVAAWRSNGETDISITAKTFAYTLGAKLLLKDNILDKMPFLKLLVDSNGYIDLDETKNVTIQTITEFRNKNKPIIIPQIDWELDEGDMERIFELAKDYAVKE